MRELLAFYQEAGVDAAVGETPVDRLAEPASRRPRRPPAPHAAGDRRPPRPPPARTRHARATSRANAAARRRHRRKPPSWRRARRRRTAADLDELRAILDRFEGCALRATATQLVFARGNPQARVMFVGEAPGYEEDNRGCRSSAAPASCSTA